MGQCLCYWNALSYSCSLQCKTYLPGMSEALTPVSEQSQETAHIDYASISYLEIVSHSQEPEQNVPSSKVQLPRVTDWKDTFGGYDCKFVTPPTSVLQTDCPICRLILRDPYQAKCCGTDFCHSCIQHLPTDNKRCPNCREDKFEVFEDKRLKHSLSQLQVWCTHKDGCRWSGELGDLEHHLKTGVHSGELVHRAGWEYCIHCQCCCQELARKLMLCVLPCKQSELLIQPSVSY